MRLILSCLLIISVFINTNAQENSYSRLFDFYPLNGELGLQVYIVVDGYLLLVQNDCVTFPTYNSCRTCIKLSKSLEINWIVELDMTFSWFHNLVELSDSYLIGGGREGAPSSMLLASIDKSGNLQWQKDISSVDNTGIILRMMQVSEQELGILSIQKRPEIGLGVQHPYFMITDLDGTMLDTFFFNEDYRWNISSRVIKTTTGKFLISFIHCPVGNCSDYRPAGVVCIDRDNGVQWRTLWPDGWLPAINAVEQTDSNIITVIYQTRDHALPLNIQAPPAIFYLDTSGQILDSIVLWSNHLNQVRNTQGFWQDGIVACGQQYLNAETNNPGPYFGWMFRVDENKEVRWQRSYSDTTYEGRNARFNHIKQTPDGGFVLIGTIDNKLTGVNQSLVWLMKVDSNGCLTPGCDSINIITTTEPVAFPSGLTLRLYPNPATSEVILSLPPEAPDHDLLVSLLSSSGQVLRQQPYLHPGIRFDTSGLTSGMYYVTVHRKGSLVGVEKLVISH